ncbi:2OG-Fe(II) oxygenase superfamily-domain-containing protein [Balamuthia mandrillaris]
MEGRTAQKGRQPTASTRGRRNQRITPPGGGGGGGGNKPLRPRNQTNNTSAASSSSSEAVSVAGKKAQQLQQPALITPISYVPTAVAREQATVEILQPGLVLLRNVIDLDTQRWFVQECFRLGEGKDESSPGFFTRQGNLLKLNMGTRGRLIEPISSFPPRFAEQCQNYLSMAMAVDGALPPMTPTTTLVNFYTEGATFKPHKDSEDPQLVQQKKGKPIVSLTIGLSADFGYKDHYEDEHFNVVRLNSGDVIIFGGPSRMIVHTVLQVVPKTMPAALRHYMLRNGRLNITFREVSGSLDTSQFPRYRVSYNGET